MMARKGGMSTGAVVAVVLIVGLAVLGAAYFIGGNSASSATVKSVATSTAKASFCNDNPSVDFKGEAFDDLKATTTRRNVTLIGLDKTTGEAREMGTLGQTSGGTTLSDALVCGHAYDISVKVEQNGTNGLSKVLSLSADDTKQDPVIKTLKVTTHDNLRGRAKDLELDQYVDDDEQTDNTTTDFENLDNGREYYGTNNGADTAKAIGADETLRYRFELKTQTADTQFGEQTLVCIDYQDADNADDWDADSIVIKQDGVSLKDVTETASATDRLGCAGYEVIYQFNKPIGESTTSLEFEMTSGSGINPDFDPELKFVGTGGKNFQLSNKNPTKVLSDMAFLDDTSKTEVSTGTEQYVVIDIS